MNRRLRLSGRLTGGLVLVALATAGAASRSAPPDDERPHFTASGALLRPTGWEKWVMVGASIGLSYAAAPAGQTAQAGQAPGMFHNVYLQPWAYRYVLEHGSFPDEAMFVLAFYGASQKSAPAKAGFYEAEGMGFEVHLKKSGVDSTGWGFYGFGDSATAQATKVPAQAACYSCHAREAAFDNAFVQFYPALRPYMRNK